MEDVPADQTSNVLAALERTCANRAHVVADFVVHGSGEVEVVRVWAIVAQVGESIEFDIPSVGIRNPWRCNTRHDA